MIDAKSLRRALVLTTALAACAAPTATARVADAPAPGGVMSTTSPGTRAADHGLPPRVNGIGEQPHQRTNVVAIPITQPSHRHGFDWPSAAIAAAALLSLALLGLAARSMLTGVRAASERDSDGSTVGRA
jgi:hypothetical protein